MELDFGSWQALAHSDRGEHLTGCIEIAAPRTSLQACWPASAAPARRHEPVRWQGPGVPEGLRH